VTGLQARGAVGVDITWKNGKATRVVLRPRVDGPQIVRPPRGQQIAGMPAAADGTVKLTLRAGRDQILDLR
jgi:hypothetical protein